ncbi:hypothetical protein [Thermus scotoductus]|uniref:hypothetical protein n=1 Tax=Thermus scotoductus TaxID=37636 RepID=UPI0020A33E36|nr:hypothetical protein [Thermus scotoductus]
MREEMLRRKVEELEAHLAHLEAERQKLLARLAYLEAQRLEARGAPGRGAQGVLSRKEAEELHALLSAVWLDLTEVRPARVPDLDRALRLLERALTG